MLWTSDVVKDPWFPLVHAHGKKRDTKKGLLRQEMPVPRVLPTFFLAAAHKYNRFIGAFYSHVLRVEQSDEREITFTFDAPGNREMPVILGQLRVLPKHWWEGMTR